jgi:hypothetical protein
MVSHNAESRHIYNSVVRDIDPCNPLKVTEVSVEYIASIVRIEEKTK